MFQPMRNKIPAFNGLPGIFVLLILLTLGVGSVRASGDQLWGSLLFATNQPLTEPIPEELLSYEKQLKKIFGYRYFKALGQSTRSFKDSSEQWLIPGEKFSVRSFVQPTADSRYKVALQLFQNKKELVQTVAKLGPDSPLFIRGPLYGNGQLIIVVMVKPAD